MSRIRHATETFVNHLIEGVKKLIESNTEQINVLFEHFYWDLSEINMNNNSTLNDIFNAMKDKSQLACGIVNGGTDIYPRAYGTLKITRITSLIGCAEFSFDKGNRRFIGDFRSVSTNLTEFSGWKEIATTTKTDILQCLTGGWTVVSDCVFSAQKIGNRIFIEGIIQNSSPGQKTIAVGLPIPSDRKWHGGVGVGSNNGATYMVVDPTGTLSFQSGGYTQGIPYSISIDYPV